MSWLRATGLRWFAAVLVLAVLPAVGAFRWKGRGHPAGWVISLWAVVGFWLLVLVVLEWAGKSDANTKRARYGYLNVVIGADGRVSTSKTAAAIWTAVLASALVLLCGVIVFGKLDVKDAFGSSGIWN